MATLFTALGAMALAGGAMNYYMFPTTLSMGLKYMINLKEGGLVYPMFMNPPFASDASYRVYAIKNPKQVLMGEKMEFEIKGPYYYQAYIWRDNIAFMKDGEVVQYDSHRTLYLDEEKSANLDERFWMLNPIFPGVHAQVQSMVMDKVPFKRIAEPIVYNSVNVFLDQFKERLIVKKSARELLQGQKVQMLEILTGLAERFGLQTLLPPGPPENTFGVAHFQNHTSDRLQIYTGVGGTRDKFGEVLKWKDMDHIKVWRGRCNVISGTNGELHKIFPKPGKPLTVFLAQLCRTFTLDPVSDKLVPVNHGVMALEYKLTDKLYQGAKTNPSNKCFCIDPKAYECQLDGFINMGPCFFDAPLFFSRPNMKGVDRRIRSLVDEETLEVDVPERQSFYLEPITGTILKANLTLVGVFKVVRQPYMRDLARIQNLTFAPVFIATESIDLPYSLTWQLKYLQMLYFNYKLIFMALGGAGAGMLAFRYLFMRSPKKVAAAELVAPAAATTPTPAPSNVVQVSS